MITQEELIEKLISIYEKEYIDMLCKERMLPDIRDGLRIVQRRIIWAMYQLLKSNNKLIKSANVVGETIKYHPHGDQSIYQSLVNMVNDTNNQIIYGKGNWGYTKSLTPSGAAAMRYTEVKFGNFFNKYFNYINESNLIYGETNELEPEFIPVPIPYSLLYGFQGIVKSIGVSNIYPFKFEDLMIRLYRLLAKKFSFITDEILNKYEEVKEYPLPYIDGLEVVSDDIQKIYTEGRGKIYVYPDLEVDDEKQKIYINNVSKYINLSKFVESFNKNSKFNKVYIKIKDLSRHNNLKIEISFSTKYIREPSITFQEFKKYVKDKLTISLNYNMLVYEDIDKYPLVGVDKWILTTYNIYLNFYKKRIENEIKKLEKKIEENLLLKKIRPDIEDFIHNNKKITSKNLDKFKKKISKKYNIDNEVLSNLFSKSINKLLSTDIDLDHLQSQIKNNKSKLILKNILKDSFSQLI